MASTYNLINVPEVTEVTEVTGTIAKASKRQVANNRTQVMAAAREPYRQQDVGTRDVRTPVEL